MAPSRASDKVQEVTPTTELIRPFEERDFTDHLRAAENGSNINETATEDDDNKMNIDQPSNFDVEVDDMLPYAPHPVPAPDTRNPSYRDDVRRTIVNHGFVPSRSFYTAMSDIYALFISDNGHEGKEGPILEEKFRSSLGRVLRPPVSADAFARSFAAPSVRRAHGFISMVSKDCETVNLMSKIKDFKKKKGQRRRDKANSNEENDRIREERRIRRIKLNENPPQPEVPQHVSFRYVDEFVTLTCARDLLKLKLFPNGKEMAESMSAYAAVREHLQRDVTPEGIVRQVSFDDPNIKLVAVGDGCTPRTACLFAFRTKWKCVSVDPLMRQGPWLETVANLSTHRARIQDVNILVDNPTQKIIVVMWHAHVSIKSAVSCLSVDGVKWDVNDPSFSASMRSRVAIVSCACCNFDWVQREMPDGSPPDSLFEDVAVPGEKRMVRVWKFQE